MTSQQYKAELQRLGINHPQAARLLGIHRVTSRRYATGDLDVPDGRARLLQIMTVKQANRMLAQPRCDHEWKPRGNQSWDKGWEVCHKCQSHRVKDRV